LIEKSIEEHNRRKRSKVIFNQGEMQFLFDYHAKQEDMVYYATQTPVGFIDVNIHLAQGCDAMQLRRRLRKKVRWDLEGDHLIPSFLRDGAPIRAFLVHFQGPGKRIFWRFSAGAGLTKRLKCEVLNILCQSKFFANLT
jgi:hypothetical protein